MRIVVLGSGMVGKAVALDLAADRDYNVTVADRSEAALAGYAGLPRVSAVQADLSDSSTLNSVIAGADLVVGALPGFMGFRALQSVIQAGINVVDISFFPEDPFDLHEEARANGVTAIMDCGLAPGLSNLVLGRLAAEWEQVESFTCYVGGLPVVRRKPFEYQAVFSPIDVIEEYTRPARIVENGFIVTKPALSDVETLEVPRVGTLEAFNSDGLRTLLHMPVPEMKEKTLRYPGHADIMRLFRDTGFFNYDPITVNGQQVRPIDVTSVLLFPLWQRSETDRDMTVMLMSAIGISGDRRVRRDYALIDHYDEKTGTTSMARTTGYACTAAARLVVRGAFERPGVCAPEVLGADEITFSALLEDMAERNIAFAVQERDI